MIQKFQICLANLYLTEMGEPAEAIHVLRAMRNAEHKPDAYYANLSHAQLKVGQFLRAMQTDEEGLWEYPGDPGLIGNLLIAQTHLGLFDAASGTARVRLAQNRDTSSLLEVSQLHTRYADSLTLTDWPLAVKNYEFARDLLKEAVGLNPRDLRLRIQLCNVLQSMGAYARCCDQLALLWGWKLHLSDRFYLIYLRAYCLDRMGLYEQSASLCEEWLEWHGKRSGEISIPAFSRIRVERVRAITLFDGFCPPQNGTYITEHPEPVWFLHHIT